MSFFFFFFSFFFFTDTTVVRPVFKLSYLIPIVRKCFVVSFVVKMLAFYNYKRTHVRTLAHVRAFVFLPSVFEYHLKCQNYKLSFCPINFLFPPHKSILRYPGKNVEYPEIETHTHIHTHMRTHAHTHICAHGGL